MLSFQSFLQEADTLVPIAEATMPPPDDQYIEGAIELVVDHKPILERRDVDLVDQLWMYLVRGLEEVLAGKEFSTNYPDMPLKVLLQPKGALVAITVSGKKRSSTATVSLAELRSSMVPAAEDFFRRLAQLSSASQARCQRYLDRLARLG